MRVARERMLCIVTPAWPGGGLAFGDARLAGLQRLFDDVGVVHFAAVALLPPRPDEPVDAPPSLMLELAVDEGLRPDDLLQRLAHHPGGALWSLYGAWWPDVQPPSVGARNEALLALLRRGLSVADGAFVGPRDLSVAQVRAHRRLGSALRAQGAQVGQAERARADRHALALARWAFAQPQFESIARPAPRSYWRAAGVSGVLRRGAMWAGAFALTLWLLHEAAQRVGAMLLPMVGGPRWSHAWLAGLHAVAEAAARATGVLVHLGIRLLLALLAVAFVYLLLFVLLPAVWKGWRRWLDALERMLDSPGDSVAARAACSFGLLLLPWPVAVLAWVACGSEGWSALQALTPAAIGFALRADGVALLALGLVLAVGLPRDGGPQPAPRPGSRRGLARFRAWFCRARHAPVAGAQQVHRSIDESDARLVGGTAHLISLTELRAPRGWSALCTRVALRVVTWAGHMFFTDGRLGHLRGIQFGHWHLIDGGRRYLFCSNFDGNFGGYLDDFIQGASGGTTLFWRWTQLLPRRAAQPGQPAVDRARRFPPTRLLAYRGVRCEQAFKTYARASMLPHLFRYDACGLSGQQKIDDRRVRDALFGPRDDAADDVLMRALER